MLSKSKFQAMSKQVERPRRGMTAFLYYLQASWKEQHKNHPNEKVDFRQFNKDCAFQWGQMSVRDKRRYQALQEKDKKRFDAEMAKYKVKEEERKKAIPKRPLSAYLWFCSEERPKVREAMPDATMVEVTKELARRWQQCPEKQKIKFDAKAAKDKTRYKKEMEKATAKAENEAADNDDRDEHSLSGSSSQSVSQASESSGDESLDADN